MYDVLQTSISLDLTSLWGDLKETFSALVEAVSKYNVIFLSYNNIPPLFERELAQSLGEQMQGMFEEIAFDFPTVAPEVRSLYIVPRPSKSNYQQFTQSLLRLVVESRKGAVFLFWCSEEVELLIRGASGLPFISSYVGESIKNVRDTDNRVQVLLYHLSSLTNSPRTSEKNLPNLLLRASLYLYSNRVWAEADIAALFSDLRLLEEDIAFGFPSYRFLQTNSNSELRNTLFSLLSLEENLVEASEQAELFYYCLLYRSLGFTESIAAFERRLESGNGFEQTLSTKIRELEQLKEHPDFSKAVALLQEVFIRWFMGRRKAPQQDMRIGFPSLQITPWPRISRYVKQLCILLAGTDAYVDNWDAERIGKSLEPNWCLLFLFPQHVQIEDLIKHLIDYVQEYSSRCKDIKGYSPEECQSVVEKLLEMLFILEGIYALGSYGKKFKNYLLQATAKCLRSAVKKFGSLPAETRRVSELQKQTIKLTNIEPVYLPLNKILSDSEEELVLRQSVSTIEFSKSGLESFANLWADYMQKSRFGLEAVRNHAVILGDKYRELTEMLWSEYCRPYEAKVLQDLLSLTDILQHSLEIENNYSHIFVLLIDALSYVDWCLVRNIVLSEEELGGTFPYEEDFVLAVLPSVTPVGTSSLLSGYSPSELGLAGWRYVNTSNTQMNLFEKIDLTDFTISPKNRFTLVSNMGNTPLTQLHGQICDIVEEISIEASSQSKILPNAGSILLNTMFPTQLVIVYVDNFDEFAHTIKYVRQGAWRQYYEMQGELIRDYLLKNIIKRTTKQGERNLVIITADHGKFTSTDRGILKKSGVRMNWNKKRPVIEKKLAETDYGVLTPEHTAHPDTSGKVYAIWIREECEDEARALIHEALQGCDNIVALVGAENIRAVFPHQPLTQARLPNVLLLSKYDFIGPYMSHGGLSLGEMLVPYIRIEIGGSDNG